jgi:hypothetical protein
MHHQVDGASKQADHKDRDQQRDWDPEPNVRQSAQRFGHRFAHEITHAAAPPSSAMNFRRPM